MASSSPGRSKREVGSAGEAQAQLAAIVATSYDAIIGKTLEGIITSWNLAAERMYGYGAAEAVGKPIALIFAPEVVPEEARLLGLVRRGERVESYETVTVTKDRRRLDVLLTLSPICDELGAVIAASMITRDVTESKRVARELADAKDLLDRTQEVSKVGGWEYDAASGQITWTDEAYRIHGLSHDYDPNDIDSEISFYGPGSAPIIEAALRRALSDGEPYDLELDLIRADGERIWVRSVGQPALEGGRVVRVTGYIIDITQRKCAQDELRRVSEELERSNRELEVFAHSVSHDLRAPLRAIDGFSEALLEEYAHALDAPGRHYLDNVRESVQEMGELIDGLLSLSHVSRVELVRRPVDLSALARGITEALRRDDPDRRVEFAIAEGVIASSDQSLLRTALENLLGNAWKFTSTHERARIEFGVVEGDRQRAYFVRDDGVGFDMRYADKLFTPFQRLHDLSEFPGTGIGLTSVRRIVERHGGTIWMEAEPEHGATFSFTLAEEPE